MSNLDNMTSKIIKDAKVKAEEILNEARDKEAVIVKKKTETAEKASQVILDSANLEAKTIIDRILSKTELEMRNKKLKSKQDVITKVFNLAQQRLNNMKLEDFREFMTNAILSLDIDGDEEILISNKDRAKLPANFLEDLNKSLKAIGKSGTMVYGQREIDIEGGFILSKNGIEINNSFNSLVESLREDLEYEVSRILFEDN